MIEMTELTSLGGGPSEEPEPFCSHSKWLLNVVELIQLMVTGPQGVPVLCFTVMMIY